MIVLDTNVVSELMKPLPDARVVEWLDSQSADIFWLTSVVLAELLNGLELLLDGKRKRDLIQLLDDIVEEMIEDRVVSFDVMMARKFATIYSAARSKGVSVGFADCQIAAAALVHGYSVATRDELPFRAMGVTVINPWTA
ncbi:PIN domain-containing protein [Rhizobium sp. LjRoot254]|uniref:PIN domain-containing protein n=1 Tax=Rhizobium sp. LjRoot254 TaxID=3342297 RepID=UPI003ED15E6B